MHTVHRFAVAAIAVVAGCSLAALPARASSFFDFEDGTLQGWLTTSTGGSGTTSVQSHSGSLMAYITQSSGGTRSLSYDFAYDASATLAFDMQAISLVGDGTNAYGGVSISFLSALNSPLGSIGIYNTTSPSLVPAGSITVDNLQHHYASLESGFATLAGVSNAAQIATISVRFLGLGQTSFFNPQSSTQVWFDNVQVGAVPEPNTQALLLAGLGMTLLAARRLRQGRRSSGDASA